MRFAGKLKCLILFVSFTLTLIAAAGLEARNIVFTYECPIGDVVIAAVPVFGGASGQAKIPSPSTVVISIPEGSISPYYIHANRLDGNEWSDFGTLTISIDGGEAREVILLKDLDSLSILYSFIL